MNVSSISCYTMDSIDSDEQQNSPVNDWRILCGVPLLNFTDSSKWSTTTNNSTMDLARQELSLVGNVMSHSWHSINTSIRLHATPASRRKAASELTQFAEQHDRVNKHRHFIQVDNVQLINRFASKQSQSTTVTVYITTTHLMYRDVSLVNNENNLIFIPINLIASVERGPISVIGCTLTIKTKHFMQLDLVFNRDKECQDVYESLAALSQPVNLEDVYAFGTPPSSAQLQSTTQFDIRHEYKRMGLPNDKWMLTDFNVDYQYCDTYPEHLCVPATATKQILIGSCSFRSRGRLPALSYYHAQSKASICRCSQPLTGFTARCDEDEKLMEHIRKANADCNVLYLIDTRPRLNAMFNKAQGKGFENEKNYANARFHFFNIENIHVMRGSLQKVIEVSQKPTSMNAFLNVVDQSGWLRHIRLVLEASRFIAESVAQGISCVVHCSDGWDRTAQTVALAQLLLDPYYRTMQGFQVLIEKDWLAFGHKFSDRCGHTGRSSSASFEQPDNVVSVTTTGGGMGYAAKIAASASGAAGATNSAAKEVSPIFTQFLDCVWQVMQQCPMTFEFNELFLIELHEYAHSCQFGTFLGNCDKDRKDLRLHERTQCAWAYMLTRRQDYVNILYAPTSNTGQFPPLLRPDVRIQSIRYWRSLYNRYNFGLHQREPVPIAAGRLQQHINLLTDHLQVLQNRISQSRSKTHQLMSTSTVSTTDSGVGSVLNDDPLRSSNNVDGINHPLASSPESATTTTTNKDSNRLLSQSLASLDMSDQPANQLGPCAKLQSIRADTHCNECDVPLVHAKPVPHCVKCGRSFCVRCVRPLTSSESNATTLDVSPLYLSIGLLSACDACVKTHQLSIDTATVEGT